MMPISLSIASGHIDVVVRRIRCEPVSSFPAGRASPWFRGRYCAVIREDCDRFCVRDRSAHHHFEFDTAADVFSRQAQQVSVQEYINGSAAEPGGGASVNDWRFTCPQTRDVVEMRLDAPGSVKRNAVVRFNATHFNAVRQFFWVAEEHNGAFRAVRITDTRAMHLALPNTGPTACGGGGGTQDHGLVATNDSFTEPLMHQVLRADALGVHVASLHADAVMYADGDMLNNTDANMRLMPRVPPLRLPTAGGGSSTDEDAFDDAAPPTRRRRRHVRNKNNTTGVPGLSRSRDGSRFQVKINGTEGRGPIRKSFSILGLKRVRADDPESQSDDLQFRVMHAYDRATDFITTHADWTPEYVACNLQPVPVAVPVQ